MRYSLNGEWNLGFTAPEGGHVEARAAVPGNVEIELERLGLVKDCMPADDLYATTKFDSVDDWTYTRTFDAPDAPERNSLEMVFEGIDTIADIYVNGDLLYEARDMFAAHRFDVRGKLMPKGNQLKVVIRSALLWARNQEEDVFGISRDGTCYGGQPHLRKARHEWGWDNAPRLLTSGIYRDAYLESLPPERFDEVYLYTAKVGSDKVSLGAVWNYKTPEANLMGCTLRVKLVSEGNTAYEAESRAEYPRGALRFDVPRENVKLWWPRGFGEASLCDATLEMVKGGEVRARWTGKWGIRTLRLLCTEDITPDNEGEFVFMVNNQRVYINGTNWKPLDALHSRADAKVERALQMALDLNCNMVRIWGGGIYEDHPFFDFCDRNGLMVWQDFMFGCEFPPRDPEYCRIVSRETDQIVKKLRNHPSLAVWCGDNEDDECLTWTHGDSTILPSDNKITREILRECVLRHDPYRSYVASSPYASDANIRDRRAGNVTHIQPEAHLYPPTMHFDQSLRDCKSRFIGETGPIVVNAMTDNERIFHRESARAIRLWDKPLDPALRNLRTHQSDDYFMSWRQTGKELCLAWFRRDFTIDAWKDYCLAVNIICSDVFKDAIEVCRTDRWTRTGVIWWSLYDMWPMLFNYSVADCDFHKKLPYYWIRQSQQPFALMAVRRAVGGEIGLYAANDTLDVHAGDYEITGMDGAGNMRFVAGGAYREAPNGARMIQRLPEGDRPEMWLIKWTEKGETRANHFVTGSRPYDFEAWRRWTDKLAALYGVEP